MSSKVVFRSSDRIYFRPPCLEADLDLCVRWINDPEITKYLTRAWLPVSREAEKAFLESVNTPESGEIVFIIVTKSDDQAIGIAGLHNVDWKSRDAAFGIFIGEKQRHGNGYGREATNLVLEYAFQTLGLNRVSSAVWDFNTASIAMHGRCGFRKEGAIRKKVFLEGAWRDLLLFGILREEWLQMHDG